MKPSVERSRLDDETPPIINKGCVTLWPCYKRITKKGEPHKGRTSSSQSPSSTLSLIEPSSPATASLSKQRLPAHALTPLTPFAYKMCTKLEKEGLQCPSSSSHQTFLFVKPFLGCRVAD
jgi:hypothetical protein